MCQTATKTIIMDRKNRKALALLCLMSGRWPNAANSSDIYFHSIQCYASYLRFVSGDKHGCSSWKNVFGRTLAKPMVVDRRKEGTSSTMFGVGTSAKCRCEFKQCEFMQCPQRQISVHNLNFLPSTLTL